MTQTDQGNPVPCSAHRFLITGAKGFIGAWVVKELVDRGDQPLVFDIDAESARLATLLTPAQVASLRLLQGDITQFKDVERAIVDHGITHVLHLAGIQVPFCAADPLRGAMINVVGTLNVFEVARRRRDLVQSIVYASSAAVFGPEETYGGGTIQEGAPLLPGTHYGVFKQCNEGNARVYFLNDGLSSVGIRPGSVYGVGRDRGMTSGPTKAIKAAVIGQAYTIRYTGGMDLQYVRDTARTFVRCAEAGLTGAKVYTLRGEVMQVHEYLAILGQILPVSQTLIKAEGKALPVSYDFDDSALHRDVPGIRRTPLEDGIRETAAIFERLKLAGTLDTKDLDT
ncbi:MAG TPA: NAD-dependent epimerase/dehydratase family protein [Terriglobia bacterium]|nr:NAD-dependent epimerase/dehydratase family protein [Terriglobia bacterium]